MLVQELSTQDQEVGAGRMPEISALIQATRLVIGATQTLTYPTELTRPASRILPLESCTARHPDDRRRRQSTNGKLIAMGWARFPLRADGQHAAHREVGDDGGRVPSSPTSAVVGLGALCGVRTPTAENDGSSLRVWVSEFARLADGRLVILHDDRGFSIGPALGPGADAAQPHISFETVSETVRAVVLPDPEDGEDHPWSWLAELAVGRGLNVTPDELRALPYDLLFTEDLIRQLSAP